MAAKKKLRESKPAKKPVARKTGPKKSVAMKTALKKTLVKTTAAKSTSAKKQSGKKSGTKNGKKSPATGPRLARAGRAGLGVAVVEAREVRDEGVRMEAGPGDAQASLQVAHQGDRELQNGVETMRLVTQAVSAAMGPVVEGQASLRGVVEGLLREIADIKNRLPPQEPAAGSGISQAALAGFASADMLVNSRRRAMWRAETNQRQPLRLPRPTIIGRALREIAVQRGKGGLKPTKRDVFEMIRDCGPHHLSPEVTAATNRRSSTTSSHLRTLLDSRYMRLVDVELAEPKGDGYRLRDLGMRVFNGWPDWDVADDDKQCEGFSMQDTDPQTPALAEPETVGPERDDTGAPR